MSRPEFDNSSENQQEDIFSKQKGLRSKILDKVPFVGLTLTAAGLTGIIAGYYVGYRETDNRFRRELEDRLEDVLGRPIETNFNPESLNENPNLLYKMSQLKNYPMDFGSTNYEETF